jgi:hypothetical protein
MEVVKCGKDRRARKPAQETRYAQQESRGRHKEQDQGTQDELDTAHQFAADLLAQNMHT